MTPEKKPTRAKAKPATTATKATPKPASKAAAKAVMAETKTTQATPKSTTAKPAQKKVETAGSSSPPPPKKPRQRATTVRAEAPAVPQKDLAASAPVVPPPIESKAAAKIPAKPVPVESTAATRSVANAALRPGGRKLPPQVKIPPILLEGDATPPVRSSGPGARYALTAPERITPVAPLNILSELPESYGTGRLLATARDPHWLYIAWDIEREEQLRLNATSREGHLLLRVAAPDRPALEIANVSVHPESRNWFVHVPEAATRYEAALGYYSVEGHWIEVSRSRSTFTPPEAPVEELAAEFVTLPPTVTYREIEQAVQHVLAESAPLVAAITKAAEYMNDDAAIAPSAPAPRFATTPDEPSPRFTEHRGQISPLPKVTIPSQSAARHEERLGWSPQQAAEIAKLVTLDSFRRVWAGSIEITELVRRKLLEITGSLAAAELSRREQILPAISSFGHAVESAPVGSRQFWFNVNAELIVYGATEANAKVSIAGRKVKLRPDGTFSFRFSLPDGRYELPLLAVSRDGEESREARLRFSRASEYERGAGVHPQDMNLRPPEPASIARA